MAIFEYNPDTIDKDRQYKFAIVIGHQEMQPYVGEYNYLKQYTLPRFIKYSQDNKIDLILITDFKKKQYKTSEPPVFGNRITTYFFEAMYNIINYYDYITQFSSHALLHKNMPSLYDIVDYSYDVIVPEKCYNNPIQNNKLPYQSVLYTLKYSAAKPNYNKSEVYNFYIKNNIQWQSGPHIICNSNMKQWFNPQNLYKFQMNDMIYHYVDYVYNHDKYKMKIQSKLNMLSMNLMVMSVLQHNAERSLSFIIKKVKEQFKVLKQQLQSNKFIISYFGGCGSYSSLWKLRPEMMKIVLKELGQYYYDI